MNFDFATAERIVFGAGSASQLPGLARGLGRRALLVTGRARGGAAAAVESLEAAGQVALRIVVGSEPTIDDVRAAATAATGSRCDSVVAVGGGSVIDTGKAVAALLTNGGDPLDYLEVIGEARPLAHRAAATIAVPTTAGSGAEVTRNAVLSSPAHRVKASLRHASMIPRVALVDPALTLDLPPALTATTGLDALAQLIEPYLSRRATPMTDILCRDGMALVSAWLRTAYHDGANLEARERMSLASLFGGLALANAGLGAVHGFAGPLGGRLDAPHGALCAALLPAVMRVNLSVLRARGTGGESLARFADVARLLTGRRDAEADDAVEWLESIREDLGIPRLAAYGVTAEVGASLLPAVQASSSMKGNPIELTDGELAEIVNQAS
jgi:alcohol dehydrogenase class IV